MAFIHCSGSKLDGLKVDGLAVPSPHSRSRNVLVEKWMMTPNSRSCQATWYGAGLISPPASCPHANLLPISPRLIRINPKIIRRIVIRFMQVPLISAVKMLLPADGAPQCASHWIHRFLDDANVGIALAKRILDCGTHALDLGQDAAGKRYGWNLKGLALHGAHALDEQPDQVGKVGAALVEDLLGDRVSAIGACHHFARELRPIAR